MDIRWDERKNQILKRERNVTFEDVVETIWRRMMMTQYKPNFKILDEEEKDLQNLDASTAVPENIRETILSPYRSEPRKSVTMRLSESVISGLKAKADNDGLPYQTLASMILQKYINGSLLDKDAVKEVVTVLQESR